MQTKVYTNAFKVYPKPKLALQTRKAYLVLFVITDLVPKLVLNSALHVVTVSLQAVASINAALDLHERSPGSKAVKSSMLWLFNYFTVSAASQGDAQQATLQITLHRLVDYTA